MLQALRAPGAPQALRQPRPTTPARRRRAALLGASTALALTGLQSGTLPQAPAGRVLAQSTPSLMEFRWDNNKDYNKLYYFITNTIRLQRSDYFLVLRPKDRKTAILKLTITVPDYFDAKLYPNLMKLCRMSPGGMTKRTRCEEVIPADISVPANGKGIEVLPHQPIPVGGTVGLMMTLFNPFTAGMFQFNALAQAPGEIPVSGYLGSWLIEIDPN
ncbi:MAG: DUF2808 domain-containing protein [Synechococcaceae cyanobacterium]|nr:DUF2808 domain-containing protein [Synechococcaceae cyanobacterium]